MTDQDEQGRRRAKQIRQLASELRAELEAAWEEGLEVTFDTRLDSPEFNAERITIARYIKL